MNKMGLDTTPARAWATPVTKTDNEVVGHPAHPSRPSQGKLTPCFGLLLQPQEEDSHSRAAIERSGQKKPVVKEPH